MLKELPSLGLEKEEPPGIKSPAVEENHEKA
jgi:hypothetical protein